MKKILADEGWVQKIVRIRADYIKLCSYYEFIAAKNNIDTHIFFDKIFTFSLNHLLEHGFFYEIDEYKPIRKPKGFIMEGSISNEFTRYYNFLSDFFKKKYNRKLYVCELFELILYIYASNKLDETQLKQIGIDFGIRKIDNA